jgi:class 3 adenylate cyclase/tetratricopeptide (TPR) repeat protein
MSFIWQPFVPYHVAREILARPGGESPLGYQQHFHAVVLFADIAGFTALSEALGASGKNGTEQLTILLNRYFTLMIDLAQSYGGIIGKFGGDSLTVLFPLGSESEAAVSRLALQCALDMQARMEDFATITTQAGVFGLTMKAGLATGPILCTTIGDPAMRLEYVIAGHVLDRCTEAEHLAQAGEVVVAAELIAALDPAEITEQRAGFAVIGSLMWRNAPHPLPVLIDNLSTSTDRTRLEASAANFIHPSIAQRLLSKQAAFINEHRKVTMLFARFAEFDYDQDPLAAERLQAYLLQVIQIINRYDGYLNKVDMGDKGSKFVALFGAPIAHEDDAERALHCAMEINALPQVSKSLQIGVNTGFVYAGLVGSNTRQEYTVMGDAVNLAARLMQAAGPGQILVGDVTRRDVGETFTWQASFSLEIKGKTGVVQVHQLGEARRSNWLCIQEPKYALPMVGRQAELDTVVKKMARVRQGEGQIIGLTAEAGMGKSRLVAEIVHQALSAGFTIYGGECLSHGTTTSYLVWRNLLGGLFGLDPADGLDIQQHHLEAQLMTIDPRFASRLPLLGNALNLHFPDNDLTRQMEAKTRKLSLEDLIVGCLRHIALGRRTALPHPLLLVLEDCHWIDALSADLLYAVGRSIVDLPVLILVVYRPPEIGHIPLAVTRLGYFQEISLQEFTLQEAQKLIHLKLEQLFGADTLSLLGQSTDELVERILQRAQGNPFFIEEMINLIHDHGLDPSHLPAWQTFELPESLHSLIISRIDRLTETTKTTLKVASVIGRAFCASWLWGVVPELGTPQEVKDQLVQLSRLDITPLDRTEPELEYSFKHIVTREVAYESLALATRAELHGAVGAYIERTFSPEIPRYLDLLAHHFSLSKMTDKQRVYFRMAGNAARAAYANTACLDYYQRLLPLVEGIDAIDLLLDLGGVWELTGDWSAARKAFQDALEGAQNTADLQRQASSQLALGRLYRLEGEFAVALKWLEQSQANFRTSADAQGQNAVLREIGIIHWSQGNFTSALACFKQCQQIAESQGDMQEIYRALGNLGLVYWNQGELDQALACFMRALEITQQIQDRLGGSIILGNIGNVYLEQGRYLQALHSYTQNLHFALEMGDRLGVSMAVGNLGNIYWHHGQYAAALQCYTYNLELVLDLGDQLGVANALWNLGNTFASLEGEKRPEKFTLARRLLEQAVALGYRLDTPYETCEYLNSLAELTMHLGDIPAAQAANNQAQALAEEVENPGVLFNTRLRQVLLEVQLGQISTSEAIIRLQGWLGERGDPESDAAIHYMIWQIDPAQAKHRLDAAELYHDLFQNKPNIDIKKRLENLIGTEQAHLPLLSSLPSIITSQSIDLSKVLERAGRLTSQTNDRE